MTSSFYVTTPIYYVNGEPHFGTAYTTVACDVFARFERLRGNNVMFLTGTDEHGQKVAQAAATHNESPMAYVDRMSEPFRAMTAAVGASSDDFIRTTEPRHNKAATAFWNALKDKGHIYLGAYKGWYCVRDEAFYGADELVDGKAPTGAPVEWVEEPSYFFDLSKWQEPLLAFYRDHPDFIAPASRRNEVIRFVEGGLRDLSVSRSTFSWGIPVPGDEKHVMYVWLDALVNYISALGYPDVDDEKFTTFWPHSVHVVGKDILRFHAVYWPAFLMAAGLSLPKRLCAHGWWTNEGQKMSKSLGNTIDPMALVTTFGLDPVRYFMMREISFGSDGDFSRSALIQRTNSQLSNEFGNLVQRVLAFVAKNAGGVIPNSGTLNERDLALMTSARTNFTAACDAMSVQLPHRYLEKVWDVVGDANRYMDAEKPWGLKHDDPVRMETVLYTLMEVIRRLALMVMPVMPGSGDKILDLLAVAPQDRTFAAMERALAVGVSLPTPSPIFPRFVEA